MGRSTPETYRSAVFDRSTDTGSKIVPRMFMGLPHYDGVPSGSAKSSPQSSAQSSAQSSTQSSPQSSARPLIADSLPLTAASTIPRSVQPLEGLTSDGPSGTMAQTTVSQTAGGYEVAAVNQAKRAAHAAHERHLKQIGADLHDGPAQLLALALLHIDTLDATKSAAARAAATAAVHDAVMDALAEVRGISVGLVLPELDRCNAVGTARLAIENYQRRTGCRVAVFNVELPANFDPSRGIKICLYRLIQEGLQNGFKHAQGADQSVDIHLSPATIEGDAVLIAKVRDSRPAPCSSISESNDRSTWRVGAVGTSTGIGLTGLKERITALSGTFEINMTTCSTELVARFTFPTNFNG